jgi:putative ABC transport system substrate-binding protein
LRAKVDVIVADTTQATQAAQHATSTVPIVMAIVADPVGSGVVANLSRPSGNVTGLSIMLAELSAKRLQLLKEAVAKPHTGRRSLESADALSCKGNREPQSGSALAGD